VCLERGPLSIVSTTEELLERKTRDSGLESQKYVRRESAVLTLSAKVGTNYVDGIVRSRTKPRSFIIIIIIIKMKESRLPL
jgi:hypothetical protein